MLRLSEQEKQEIIRVPIAPDAQEAFEGIRDALPLATFEEQWTGDYVFETSGSPSAPRRVARWS